MHDIRFSGEQILARQLELAQQIQTRLSEHAVRAIGIMGAIGSGKTSLVERILERLASRPVRCGAIAADSAGDDDHRRFLSHGAISVNLNTCDDCHLDARRVGHALDQMSLDDLDVLFIENVGNLICPADFPLGTAIDAVVISVTEGDDMVRKHPKIFTQNDVLVINKIDLASAVGVNPQILVDDYLTLNPHGRVFLTNASTAEGIDALMAALEIPCTSTR
ncbi:hydrogenase nickel incorporation protein HypB [Candidatus Bipolaricaulota bacterium]|nr:hydrogenase nickel incorporation protein HypB [Candidatus Bipolaricaulota bacterium]